MEPTYTKNQIERAIELINVLYSDRFVSPDWRTPTKWGTKTYEGLKAVVLRVMFDKKDWK